MSIRTIRRPASILAAPAVGLTAVLLLGGCSPSAPAATASASASIALPGLAVTGDAPTTAAAGEEFAPVNVLLADTSGEPVADATVTFSVESGDAAFPDDVFTTTTDSSGVATAYGLVAGRTPGDVDVAVSSGERTLEVTLTVLD